MMHEKQNIELIISRLMLTIGFNPHLFGAVYLREAIVYCVGLKTDGKVSFSGEVYPHIASNHKSTPQRVERNIRTAIQSCYDSKSMFKFNQICGYDIISPQYPPTNSEFVMKTVEWIKTLDISISK